MTTVIGGGMKALAAAAGLACGAAAFGQSAELMVTGTIRDFSDSHPDFCKSESVGANWVEGTVGSQLGANGRPVYTGNGRRVTVPATDKSGHKIAGALIANTVLFDTVDVKLVNAPQISNNPQIDTYDPNAGPYGGSNIGPYPEIATGQAMPTVVVPTITPVLGDYVRSGNGSTVISSSFRCVKFEVTNNHVVTIQGNVVIVVTDLFSLQNHATINVNPGSKLTVYALKDCTFKNNINVNMNTWDHTAFVLYKMGGTVASFDNASFDNHVAVCGTVIAPNAGVYLGNNMDLYGPVTARALQVQNSAGLHVPEPKQTECAIVDDNPAQLGAADAGAVTSGATFNEWFQDSPGVNETAQARMKFVKDAAGTWEFETPDFRPIDGELMAQGQHGANRNFTLDVDGRFTYQPCTGQFLEFSGDGDAMVYIDGKLALELTGNNAGVGQRVDLDRFDLDPGTPHTMQFFYAQRSCSGAPFSLRTNVTLDTEYEVVSPATSCFD